MRRADGKSLRHADPMYTVAAHIMAKRSDSLNYITINIPLEPIDEYIRKKRKEGVNLSHMSVLMAAYTRMVNEFPGVNRFVVNKRIFARNEIAVGMGVLRAGQMDNGTMSKMYFKPEWTIFQVNDEINRYVSENSQAVTNNDTDKIIRALLKIPGLLRGAVCVLKWMDKHNLLPYAIIKASPFHTSMVFTNLASIRTNHIYHHCYDFGTTSVVMAAGNTREIPKRVKGEIVHEKCLPLGIVMDERIASGSYFALAFRFLKKHLQNPELLETAPEKVNPDPEL